MSAASKERRRRARANLRRQAPKAEPWPRLEPAARLNAYFCDVCGLGVVTIDRAKGTTPALLHRPWAPHRSPKCPGLSRSTWYEVPADHPPPTWEWYAPTEKEARRAGPGMYEHARRGGLFIRPTAEATREALEALAKEAGEQGFKVVEAPGAPDGEVLLVSKVTGPDGEPTLDAAKVTNLAPEE